MSDQTRDGLWEKLGEVARTLREGQKQDPVTVRTLLGWHGAQRRGYWVVQDLKKALDAAGLATTPNFEYAYIDGPVEFVLLPRNSVSKPEELSDRSGETDVSSSSLSDPTTRIGTLASANTPPLAVPPTAPLEDAITLMMEREFSQLPVMTSERSIQGVISWESIGKRFALGKTPTLAQHCMEREVIVNFDTSLFEAIGVIVTNGYVLIRDQQNKISGIVTTSDLSLQFRQLAEPFMLVGEIENYIRRLVSGKFTTEELAAAKNPADTTRTIEDVSDLTLGEYIRLIEQGQNWERLGLRLGRKLFIERLESMRTIRNDVMHFDPDGIEPDDLEKLKVFARLLQELATVGAL